MKRNRIGFVTGLKAEAALLRGSDFLVAAGGGVPEGAYRAAIALIGQGAKALVSFGIAGGLQPGLEPGTVLVPNSVIDGPRAYPCHYALMEFLGGSTAKPITSGLTIAATAEAKSVIFRHSKAVAIDLESGAVARAASEHGLPFAILRAVADPAERNLPPAACLPLKPAGGIDLPRILLSIAARPGQIPGLIDLAKDAAKARSALKTRLKTLAALEAVAV